MRWFDGTITDAISKSKSENAVFVVYITDQSSVAEANNEVLNSKDISSLLKSDNFVAIKLESDTETCTQFVQIYPLVATPCFYFIGKNGIALEIIPGPLEKNDFATRIKKVLDMHQNEDLTPTSVQGSSKDGEASSSIGSMESSDEKISSPVSIEEKVDRAKQLLAVKREKMEKENLLTEKDREMERRKLGQELLKFKEKQHQEELRKMAEERRKEKEDDRIAREKIKQLIAQDRADKKAKWERDLNSDIRQRPSKVPESSPTPARNFDSTRLQFRLPDGSSSVKEFSSQTSLGEVCQYIKNSLTEGSANFKLCTAFPRHDFTTSEYSMSLIELQLVPSAVLLVIPMQNSSGGVLVRQSSYRIVSILTLPIFAILNFIRYILSPFTPQSRSVNKPDEKTKATPANVEPSTKDSDKLPVNASRQAVKRVGNIHRLDSSREGDDEQNTWNGNSTQQM